MRAVVQRVTESAVTVDNQLVGQIGPGLMVLLGVGSSDTDQDADYLAEKIVHLRIFEDEAGKMNRSLLESGGAMLVVSQFTLLGDCRKGRRPSFADAAPPDKAEQHYTRFRAMMKVSLINDGPVTLILESKSGWNEQSPSA